MSIVAAAIVSTISSTVTFRITAISSSDGVSSCDHFACIRQTHRSNESHSCLMYACPDEWKTCKSEVVSFSSPGSCMRMSPATYTPLLHHGSLGWVVACAPWNKGHVLLLPNPAVSSHWQVWQVSGGTWETP